MAVTLVVSNRKGGTGKTTASVNLSAELAALGRRVLLVDLDSQGHCAMGLGVKVGRDAPTAHDIFRTPGMPLADAVLATAFENIALLPADTSFEHGGGLRDELLLRRALQPANIASAFDVVILDTPPTLDNVLFNALIAANLVLVPYVPHPLSLEGVRQLMRVLFKVISGPNETLKLAGFLPMMATESIRQHRTIKSDMAHQFGALRLLPGIRMDIRLAEAFAAGQPIRYYAPKSRGADDFSELASVLAEKLA